MSAYISLDGNRIGSKIEALMIQGDIDGVAALSQKINQARTVIEHETRTLGWKIIFAGGDSILAYADDPVTLDEAHTLLRLFSEMSGCTASVGIGCTPREAYLALKLAKCSDATNVVDYR